MERVKRKENIADNQKGSDYKLQGGLGEKEVEKISDESFGHPSAWTSLSLM